MDAQPPLVVASVEVLVVAAATTCRADLLADGTVAHTVASAKALRSVAPPCAPGARLVVTKTLDVGDARQHAVYLYEPPHDVGATALVDGRPPQYAPLPRPLHDELVHPWAVLLLVRGDCGEAAPAWDAALWNGMLAERWTSTPHVPTLAAACAVNALVCAPSASKAAKSKAASKSRAAAAKAAAARRRSSSVGSTGSEGSGGGSDDGGRGGATDAAASSDDSDGGFARSARHRRARGANKRAKPRARADSDDDDATHGDDGEHTQAAPDNDDDDDGLNDDRDDDG